MIYTGSLDDLRTVIEGSGHSISSVQDKGACVQIRTHQGGICNWYASTGTLQFQGKLDKKERLQTSVAQYLGQQVTRTGVPDSDHEVPDPQAPERPSTANKKVFVVHGHDYVTREQLELVLHKLGLDPFVLANMGGGGLTIIEALEKEIGPGENRARFGIVLLTPDDQGFARKEGADSTQPRARQNVVLEMGMMIAALGRANLAILKKGHVEVPSDAQGILYLPFNDHVRETVPRLVDRLRNAGFVLNPEAITRASS